MMFHNLVFCTVVCCCVDDDDDDDDNEMISFFWGGRRVEGKTEETETRYNRFTTRIFFHSREESCCLWFCFGFFLFY